MSLATMVVGLPLPEPSFRLRRSPPDMTASARMSLIALAATKSRPYGQSMTCLETDEVPDRGQAPR